MSPVITRRDLLTFGIGMTGLLQASRRSGAMAIPDAQPAAGQLSGKQRSAMKLSLSVRVAEKFHNKRESSQTIDQLIQLAKSHQYEALCMRASRQAFTLQPTLCGKCSSRSVRPAWSYR